MFMIKNTAQAGHWMVYHVGAKQMLANKCI